VSDRWLGKLVAQRYRVIAKLGEGESSEVWLARHVLLDRLVAVELLRPEVEDDPVRRGHLLGEAREASRLNHPNLVEIADAGESDGVAYVAMEYVPGETLERVLARATISRRRAAHVGECVASALARAHEMDLVHGRLAPAKIMLVPRRDGLDDVKVLAFGHDPAGSAPDLDPSEWTRAKPYAAPEVLAGGRTTARADLYALGAVLEAATCGRHGAPGAFDLGELGDVLRTLLSPDPSHRPRDAFETIDMFRRIRAAYEAPEPSVAGPERRATVVKQLAFDRIAPLCVGAFARIEAAALATSGDAAQLEQSRRLVELVVDLAQLAVADARDLAQVDARARRTRAELGARIDELASERSRALGWAGTLVDQAERVRAERSSGQLPVGHAEAKVWEQAALEHHEHTAFEQADDLGGRVKALQAELGSTHRAIEEEQAVLGARLEGHIAALRALAVEAWSSLETSAASASISLDADARRAREG
jgi:hypothetical protein